MAARGAPCVCGTCSARRGGTSPRSLHNLTHRRCARPFACTVLHIPCRQLTRMAQPRMYLKEGHGARGHDRQLHGSAHLGAARTYLQMYFVRQTNRTTRRDYTRATLPKRTLLVVRQHSWHSSIQDRAQPALDLHVTARSAKCASRLDRRQVADRVCQSRRGVNGRRWSEVVSVPRVGLLRSPDRAQAVDCP